MRSHQTFVSFQTFLAVLFLVGWSQVRAEGDQDDEEAQYPTLYRNGGGGSGPYPVGGGGGYPQGPSYAPTYTYSDLDQLEKFIHDVAAEKIQVSKRVQMLKMQKQNLLDKVDWIQQDVIPQFFRDQRLQDADLVAIKQKIKAMLHSVGDNEDFLAGLKRVADIQEAAVNPRWEALIEQVEINHRQQAVIDRSRTFLTEAKDKLYKKLNVSEAEGEGLIAELKYNTEAVGNLMNSRYCFKGSVVVEMFSNMTGVAVVYFGEDEDLHQTPTAFCDMQGFVANLSPDMTQSYGYPEQYQNLVATVDCKPFGNKLEVTVLDGSKGQYNEIERVYIHYKLCTMGPQSAE